jgi:hypothetical protein
MTGLERYVEGTPGRGRTMALDEFRGPAWRTAIATGLGYTVILILLTVLLFVVPTVLFSVL